MSSTTSRATSNKIRFTGLASGLDTEAIVNASLLNDKEKINSFMKKQTTAEWKQEQYREMITLLQKFKTSFMDNTNLNANMLRQSNYKVYTGKVTTPSGVDSTLFSISGNSDSSPGSYSIKVKQRATEGYTKTQRLSSEVTYNASKLADGQEFNIELDGESRTIKIPTQAELTNPPGNTIEKRYEDSLNSAFGLSGTDAFSVQTDATTGKTTITRGSEVWNLTDGLSEGNVYKFKVDGVEKEVEVLAAPTADDASSVEKRLEYAMNTAFNLYKEEGFSVSDGKIEVKGEHSDILIKVAGDIKYDSASLEYLDTLKDGKFTVKFNGTEKTVEVPLKTKDNDTPVSVENMYVHTLNDAFGLSGKDTFKVVTTKADDGKKTTTIMRNNVTYKTIEGGIKVGDEIELEVEGQNKKVEVKSPPNTIEERFQYALNNAFGVYGDKGFKVGSETIAPPTGSEFTIITAPKDNIIKTPITNASNENRIDKSESLDTLNQIAKNIGLEKDTESGNWTLTIRNMKNKETTDKNGITDKTFEFKGTDTLSTVMRTVNSSDIGVNMAYDQVTDSITFASKTTGANTAPEILKKDKTALDIDFETESGKDARIVFNGKTVTQSSNDMFINGMNIKLLRDPTADEMKETQTATLTLDSSKVVENIKNMVEQYNEMITTINVKLNEKHKREYEPLTDEEKESLSEDDIKRWEEKAKQGLLRRDSLLESFTNELRNAFYAEIEGVEGGIYDIGITTSKNTDLYGVLIIDEEKLKEAIEKDPDKVMDMFAKNSDISYSRDLDSTKSNQRFKECGVMQRVHDVFEKYISTSRDANNNKGLLLQKAGTSSDTSDTQNSLTKEIEQYKKKIDALQDLYYDKEDRLYKKYAALEAAMSKLNSQTNSLTSMLG